MDDSTDSECTVEHLTQVPLMSEGKVPAIAQSNPRRAPRLSWDYQLQVEGNGYIKNLTHGLPHHGVGQNDAAVVTVDMEPTVLTSVDSNMLQVGNLGHASSVHQGGGAYYEIAVAGAGFGRDCTGACVYSAKFMVVPVAASPAAGVDEPFLSVTLLGTSSGVTLVQPKGSASGEGSAINVPGTLLQFALRNADERREVVVDVRQVGRPCTDAIVELV
jgi:hypothetical protein